MFDWKDAGRISVLLLVSSLILIPLAATVLGGFKTSGELRVSPFGIHDQWHMEFYGEIFADANFWTVLR